MFKVGGYDSGGDWDFPRDRIHRKRPVQGMGDIAVPVPGNGGGAAAYGEGDTPFTTAAGKYAGTEGNESGNADIPGSRTKG